MLLGVLLAVPAGWGPSVHASQPLFEGEGTEQNPYLISSAEQLFLLGQVYPDYPGKHFRQTTEIDLSGFAGNENGKGWVPIGRETEHGVPFQSVYDGGGHPITGLTINRTDDSELGLFGTIGESGMVANVHLSGGSLNGRTVVGGLAAVNYGTIMDSSVSAEIHGSSDLGGLAGQNYGVIANASVSVTVIGSLGTVGGLVGVNYGRVIDSHVAGNNSVTCATYGTECDIVAQSTNIGGLAGINYSGGIISKSTSDASVQGSGNTGGLVGDNRGEITRSHAKGNVFTSGLRTGGLVGRNGGGVIKHSSASGHIKASDRYAGGLAGEHLAGEIAWSHASGHVSGMQDAGGLIGANEALVRYVYATGNVSGTSNVGGLIGTNGENGTVLRSYATGAVEGSVNVIGGIIGRHDGTLEDAYATGHVLNGSLAGGLAGSHGGTTRRAYASGRVPEDGGGLLGFFTGGTLESVYWNMATSGTSKASEIQVGTIDGVRGLTAGEMADYSSFTGWDFDTVWEWLAWEDGPVLRFELGWLLEVIDMATEAAGDAVVGKQPGEYPESAWNSLQAEILSAGSEAASQTATRADLQMAAERLELALDVFRDSIIRNELMLAYAEIGAEDPAVHLAFDRRITASSADIKEMDGFRISDPNVSITDIQLDEETGSVSLVLSGYVDSGHTDITMLAGAISINGHPNEYESTVRLITHTAKSQMRADLQAETQGDRIAIENIVRYMHGPGADVNGDGIIDHRDVLYLLRFIDPIWPQ